MTTLLGHVVDPQGHPVAEAAVYIVSAPVSMPDIAQLTDDRGQFALSAPIPGRYTVGARSDRWGSAQVVVVVSGEEAVPVMVKLIPPED